MKIIIRYRIIFHWDEQMDAKKYYGKVKNPLDGSVTGHLVFA